MLSEKYTVLDPRVKNLLLFGSAAILFVISTTIQLAIKREQQRGLWYSMSLYRVRNIQMLSPMLGTY